MLHIPSALEFTASLAGWHCQQLGEAGQAVQPLIRTEVLEKAGSTYTNTGLASYPVTSQPASLSVLLTQ